MISLIVFLKSQIGTTGMKMITIIMLFVLFAAIDAYSRNGLSQRDMGIIGAAFENGAAIFSGLDIEEIQELKKDRKLLRAKVYALKEDYLRQVQVLNSVDRNRYPGD